MKLLAGLVYLGLLFASISTAIIVKSSDGTDIFAEAVGNPRNPPIVFVHGFSLNALVFDDLFKDPRLLDHFYLVAYDLRGHGRSGKPNTTEGYASNLFAGDFAAVTRAFQVKAPLFVGWSYGGTVLSDIFANLAPGFISGIVAVAAIPFFGLPVFNTPETTNLVPGFGVTDDVAVGVDTRVTFINLCFADATTVPAHIIWSWYGSAVLQLPPISVLVGSRTQNATGLFAAGGRGFPTLSVFGTEDKVLANENITAEIAPHFTDLEVHRIPGGSHALFFDNKTEFIEVLVPFANRILNPK